MSGGLVALGPGPRAMLTRAWGQEGGVLGVGWECGVWTGLALGRSR